MLQQPERGEFPRPWRPAPTLPGRAAHAVRATRGTLYYVPGGRRLTRHEGAMTQEDPVESRMLELEREFRRHLRATPELQPYYIKLAGVAAGAATAEEQANANQFDAAGRTLLNVINRLTDVLVIMRQ